MSQFIEYYNGLDWFIDVEADQGSVKHYTAKVAALGDSPVATVKVSVHDPENPEVEEQISKDTLSFLYFTFLEDTMKILKNVNEQGLFDKLKG